MSQHPTTHIPANYYFPFTVYVVVTRTPSASTDETDAFESRCYTTLEDAQAAGDQLARGATRAVIGEIHVEGPGKAPEIRREWQCLQGSCQLIQRVS